MRTLTLILLLAAASPAKADLRIADLEAKQANGKISVSFSFVGAFERETITQKLQTGLPTVFAFEIQLVQKRHNWFDRTLATSTIEVAASFNSLTREYLLNHRRDEKLVESETYHDIEKLKAAMTRIVENDLFDRPEGLVESDRVRVRSEIRSELEFFIVPRRVGTNWQACKVKARQ